MRRRLHSILSLSLVAALILLAVGFFTSSIHAAQITGRSLTLSSSAGAATGVTYTFTMTLPSATVLQSAQVQICTTPSGSCTTPSGFSNASSTLPSQPTNLGDASGWTVDTATAGSLRLKKTGNVAAPTGATTITFGNVTNPTAANTTFYARVTTYSDDTWTTAVDTGTVAASTASQITLQGSVDEALTFCVGITVSGNCGSVSGTAINFGTFSPTAASTGTSMMGAGTNASGGYVITVNGTTLMSGANPIAALAAQTASSTGTAQFGANIVANTSPTSFGANPSGGSGAAGANYGTTNLYRFVTGDPVASAAGPTAVTTYTMAYLVNISTATPPGTYNATMTYICTSTF